MPMRLVHKFALPLAAAWVVHYADPVATQPVLADDDECVDVEQCALSALQRRAAWAATAERIDAEEVGEQDAFHKEVRAPAKEPGPEEQASAESGLALMQQNESGGAASKYVWHYALPCWYHCQGAGFCDNYCGPNNACCSYADSRDPPECHGVRFWPVLGFHTCVKTGIQNPMSSSDSSGGSPAPAPLIFSNVPSLLKPSSAPLLEFYMYRVQSDENYDPENQNMANIAGALWYLHNEIVWHKGLQRSGTYFSTPKTRIEKFKVKTRATQPLYDLGMNFGVVSAFDLTKCTGPFSCSNFRRYGYAVGCETWGSQKAAFPHSQWYGKVFYPNATWYSLPGPCSSLGLGEKTTSCLKSEPGGACLNTSQPPTGTGDCTYSYEKVGELSINDLEGIRDALTFKTMGGYEYDKKTDKGVHMSFWDGKEDVAACQSRIDAMTALFAAKYPDLPDLPDPTCDFDKYKFYPERFKA